MTYQLNRQKIAEGVHFSSLIDPKFKTNRISASLIFPLDEETASENALLPFLLRKGYTGCPDFTALNRKLNDLYGAFHDAEVLRVGESQILNLSIQSLDDRYTLAGEKVSQECAALLCGLLLQPKIADGAFPREDVALEKQFLKDIIESEINDKRSYAIRQMEKRMFAGEPFSISRFGELDRVEQITPQSAAKAYERAISTAQIEIMFTGCGDPTKAEEVFRAAFAQLMRKPISLRPVVVVNRAEKVRSFTEKIDVSQSKLVLGFRADIKPDQSNLDAIRMMSIVFGGTPFSRLFLNVREKLSLCYYCAARFDRIKGYMMVDSGVENEEKKDLAYHEILNQLEVMRRGEFSDDEFQSAVLSVINSFKTFPDSPATLEAFYLTQIIEGREIRSPEQEADFAKRITREEVIEAAKAVSLDTVYFLTGKQGEEN